jgi:TonB-dependent SusC/RagA subfamily outer membrane receptor
MRKLFLLLLTVVFFVIQAMAQRTISGNVTDDKGNPLPNVSVLIKGTATGTTTKADGTYSLAIPADAKTLVFTSVGMEPQEASITSSSSIPIVLSPVNKSMDEVIVVAYGVVKKEALTGSVGQIKAEQIKIRPLNNITAALEGMVPGVVTTSANGQPGSGVAIRVRGFGSINATSEPLIVLDGVPYINGISNVNPVDVESVTVLKDAASTAVYGSRAANGVLIITTKKGKKGRNNISVRVMQGFASRGLDEYERLDAFQYYPLMWEAYRNSLVYPTSGAGISLDSANRVASGLTSRTSIQGLLSYNPFFVANNAIVGTDGKLTSAASSLKYGDDLDWTKDLMRNGNRKDYSVNFNGGSDKSDYFLSMGYVKEDGYTIKTNFERYTAV